MAYRISLCNRIKPDIGNWSADVFVFSEGKKKRIGTVMGNASLCLWHFIFISRNFTILRPTLYQNPVLDSRHIMRANHGFSP